MAQIKKYLLGGVYDREDISTKTSNESSEPARIIASEDTDPKKESAAVTTSTESKTSSKLKESDLGNIDVNGVVRKFTPKAYSFLMGRISSLGDSVSAGEFQKLLDLGSQKGNTLHFDTSYNQGYVTDSAGNVIAKTQDGWRNRSGVDVTLGGWFNSRKNQYNKELSTIFKGISDDLFTEEDTEETPVTPAEITKKQFDTPLIWIESNDKNEYSAFDPSIVAAKQRIADIDKYILDKEGWGLENEFSENAKAVQAYIDSLGVNYTPEIRNALVGALSTPHLLTEDQKTILGGLNIGFGVTTRDSKGNIQYLTPEEWKKLQTPAATTVGGGSGNGGTTTVTTDPKKSAVKNIFDTDSHYLVYNNNYIAVPEGISKFDADSSGMISTPNYQQVFEWIDLDGNKYYYLMKDKNGNVPTGNRMIKGWDSNILGDENSKKEAEESSNVYAFEKNKISYYDGDKGEVKPVSYYTLSNGENRLIYYDSVENKYYVRVDKPGSTNDSPSFELYEATIEGGKITGYNSKKPRKGYLYRKDGGILYAKIGTVITPSYTANPASESGRSQVTSVETTSKKNAQKHAGDTSWSGADKWRMGLSGLGVASAGIGFIPIIGDAIGTVGGAISDVGNFVVDLVDKDVTTGQAFKNLGINAGLTALALVPGMDAAKLTKNAATAAEAAAKTTKATKTAKAAIEAADKVEDINKAMTSVKTAVEATNKGLDTIKSTEKASKAASSLKISEVVKDDFAATETLAEVKKAALDQLSKVESTITDAGQKAGKTLWASDLTTNGAQYALGATAKGIHAGLTGLGAYTSGAAAIDFLAKAADENYEFTPEDWLNMNAALTGAIGLGRRYQRASANKGIAAANQADPHVYDGVRFTTSSTDVNTANNELKATWLRAGKSEDTVPSLGAFGYDVKKKGLGSPKVVEVSSDLPSMAFQMFRTNPYGNLIPQNVSNPYNPISNPWRYGAFNAWQVPEGSPAIYRYIKRGATQPSYYGISPDFAQRFTFLNPGEEETKSFVYHKDGGKIASMQWGGNAAITSRDAYIKDLMQKQAEYDQWNRDKQNWDASASQYDFIKNQEDGSYDWEKLSSDRQNFANEYGINLNTEGIGDLDPEKLTTDNYTALYGDSYLKDKANYDALVAASKLEGFDKQDELLAAEQKLNSYKSNFLRAKNNANIGFGLSDADIEAAQQLYTASSKEGLRDYSDELYALSGASNRMDRRLAEGKMSWEEYLAKADKRAHLGDWRDSKDGIGRTPIEKWNDADLLQALEHTRKAKQIGLDKAQDRRVARKSAKMEHLNSPTFNDEGLKQTENTIEAETNSAMNSANMTSDAKSNFGYKAKLNSDKINSLVNIGMQRSNNYANYQNQLAQTNAKNAEIDYQNAAIDANAEEKYLTETEDVLQKANNLNSSQLHSYLQGKIADFKEDRNLMTGIDAKQQGLKALSWQGITGKLTPEHQARIAKLQEEISKITGKMNNLSMSSKYFG